MNGQRYTTSVLLCRASFSTAVIPFGLSTKKAVRFPGKRKWVSGHHHRNNESAIKRSNKKWADIVVMAVVIIIYFLAIIMIITVIARPSDGTDVMESNVSFVE